MLKSKYRLYVTDKDLKNCKRVAIVKRFYACDYNKLAEEMQCQFSH